MCNGEHEEGKAADGNGTDLWYQELAAILYVSGHMCNGEHEEGKASDGTGTDLWCQELAAILWDTLFTFTGLYSLCPGRVSNQKQARNVTTAAKKLKW
jgi:hypothetical protein